MSDTHLRRRPLLALTASLVALSGCQSSDPAGDATDTVATESESPTATDPETATERPSSSTSRTTVDADAATAHLDDARAAIQSAFDELNADETDVQTLADAVDTADTALADARPVATDDQRTTVATLSSVVDYLSPLTDGETRIRAGLEGLQPGVDEYWTGRDHYFSGENTAATFQDAAERFDAAATTFDDAAKDFEAARAAYATAESRLDALAPDVLEAFDGVDYQQSLGDVGGAKRISALLVQYTVGHAAGSVGWLHTSLGLAHVDAEKLREAKTAFEDGKRAFTTATDQYDATDTERLYDVLPFLESTFAGVVCEVGNGVPTTEHFVAAMEAALDGDTDTKNSELEAGFAATAECHDDGGSA